MALFFAILGVFVIAMFIFSFSSVKIPTVNSSQSIKGLNSIPENLSYRYYLDNTGIAFDIENKNIYLLGSTEDHLIIRKTYNVSMIRDYSASYGGATKYYGSDLETTMVNLRNKKETYEQSGLFINVADIDHPQWQIKFSDEKLLLRYVEILKQFMEGTLPQPQSASSN